MTRARTSAGHSSDSEGGSPGWGRRTARTAALSGLVGLSLVVTAAPPQAVAATPDDDAAAVRIAVQSLATALGAVGTTPSLQARLPLGGQSVTDVLGLDTAFVTSLGAKAAAFGGTTLDQLVADLDEADTPTLGITADRAGSTITIALTGKDVAGKVYALHSDEDLFLDDTLGAAGHVPVTGTVTGTLTLSVGAGNTVTLDPSSSLRVDLTGSRSDLSVPSRYGFSDVTAKGSASYEVHAAFDFTDPDGLGGITQLEWTHTLLPELAPASVTDSGASVELALDSSLVGGASDGTVKQTLTNAQMVPTAAGDGSFSFGAPTVTPGQGLADLAKLTSGDAIVALSQMAAAYTNAQARIDPHLPLVDTPVSELGSAVQPLNKLVEAQGAAAVTCGRADSNPPAVTTLPGTTWYCQARTSEPIAGNVKWSVTGGGEITANATSNDTVGPDPTKNIAVSGSTVEPEVAVTFDAAGADGATATFTAQRRVRTAQELAARLSALPGGTATTAAYDASTRALTFPVASDSDPDAQALGYSFGDLFRADARLRGITVDPATKLSVDVGKVSMDGTLGLLLQPAEGSAVADRAFLKVAPSGPEVAVAGISASGSFTKDKAVGMVGMTKVDLAGSGITLSTGEAPAMRANIEATGSVAGGAISDAAMLGDVLAGQDDPAIVETSGAVRFTAAATLTASAPELPGGSYTTSLSYPVDLADTLTDKPATPAVTLSDDWRGTLRVQDVAPQVSGTVSAADATGKTLTDGSASFLSGVLGPKVGAGTVLNLSLVNLRTGAQCSAFRVTATTLTCVEQGQTTGDDLTPTWQDSKLAGGKVTTTDAARLKDSDNTNNYDPDNSWKVGDPYLVEGDPTAVRSVALGGLYDAADGIQQSDEPGWVTPIPLLGIAPKALVPQLEGIRQAASEVNNLGDEPKPEDCGDSCPADDKLETAPADLKALENRVAKALKDHGVDGATTELDVQQVGGKPALVLDVTAPASGASTPLDLSLALGNGTDYWLRQAAGGTPVKPTWSSEVRLRVAVPTTPDVAFDQVELLAGSGVTRLRVQVGNDAVDLDAGLGPVDVKVGVGGALSGTVQDPEPNPVVKVAGTVAVSGTAKDAGTTLTDAETRLANLATAGVKAKRTSDSLECTAGDVSGEGLVCDLPDDTSTDPATVRDWVAGDAYTATYSSTTWLTDTAVDLTTKGIEVGDLVRTHTGTGASRTTEGVCEVKTVLKHQLECAAPLSNGKSFSNGVTYQVLPDVLVDPGASFADADLVGLVVTNKSAGNATCSVASATDTHLACEAPGLDGGTRTWFQAGDEYSVAGASSIRADVAFTFAGAADALVPAYVEAMTPKLAPGAGAPVGCGGSLSGAICAALAVRTQPTTDRPSGQALGIVKYKASIDGAGAVTETTSISNAIKNLGDGTTPLALGSLGDAFGDAGAAVSDLADESTDEADVPLVGSDATAGAWLVPLLDAYGLGLGEKMMSGALGNLPEKTPLDNVDGAGTSLVKALENAVKGAASELETPGGETMGDVLSIVPEVKCGASACDPATKTIGDVTSVALPIRLGKKATYQVPFESGLAGLPVSADFRVNSAVDWGLDLTVGIDRKTGPFVDLSDSRLSLKAGVRFPTKEEYVGGDGCPENPVSSAFDGGSPFADYNKDSCQSLTLGLLQATAYDGKGEDKRSQASVDLSVDLDKAINGTAKAYAAGQLKDDTTSQKLQKAGVSLVAKGRLNVYFVTGVNPRNGSPDAALPSVHGVLDMQFNPSGKNVWDLDLDKDWSIDYSRLYLDAGTFVDKFAGDVVRGAAKQVKPYKPLVDAVRAPVPVISDIAMLMGQKQVSLLDILEGASGSDLSFVRKVIEVLDVVASISNVGQNMLIPLGASPVPTYTPVDVGDFPIPAVSASGSFKMNPKQNKSGPCGGKMTLNKNPQAGGANGVGADGTQASPQATKTERRMPKDCTSTDKGGGVLRGKTKVIQTQRCDPTAGCTGKERAATISARIGKPKLTGTAITFPFLEDFSEVFGLLVGEDATLVRLDLGTLRASAGIGLKFGPFMAGPVPVDIGVGVSVTFGAHLALGYDTLGIRNALLNDPGEFEPAAMLDGLYIDDYDAAGNETPEMTLTLAVQLEGSVSVKIFRVGIFGGVSLTIAGDLNDPDRDGKLRIKEIRAVDNPVCLFELSGWLDFFFGFFVEVDLFIKSFRYDVELYRLKPPIKLFEVRCEPKPPVLAVPEGSNLRLKMGEAHVGGRNISEDEPKEKFKLRQLTEKGAAKDGGTLVSVEAFGIYQEHLVPAGGRIVADAGTKDDSIEMSAGVDLQNNTHLFTVPATVNGGDGNDNVSTGNGDDTVNGGPGNDRIAGNLGDDTLNGDGEDDTISGGLGTDVINGGAGRDNLSGDNGGDTVNGGPDDDQVTGGPGLSQAEYDKVLARWNTASAATRGPQPTPALRDLADTLSGGTGDDRVTGHVGDDVIFGEDPVAGAFRANACADDAGTGSGNDVLDGQVGNDWIAGGPSDDTLTGGQGDDTLCGNGGNDVLEGDEGPTSAGTGQDELRGGKGDDRLLGRGGRDYADGGPDRDLVVTGTGADVALGGTGSDGVNAGDEGDIVLGDTGTVSGVVFNSATTSSVAGVQSTGLTGTPVGKDLESKVSGADAAGTAGSATSCAPRVVLIRGAGGGKADVDGDGRITGADDGRVDGLPVVDGQVDVNGDGAITDDDAGVVADRVVNKGLVDVPAGMALDTLVWNGTGDADCLFGQDGHDALFGGAGGDQVVTGLGDDLGVGGAGNDTVRGEDGADLLRGSDGADTLYGDAEDDVVLGNAGDDTAYGGTGSDQLEGNQDADTLYGGEDTDVLVGGTTGADVADGDDTLYGGEAPDHLAGDNASPTRVGGVLLGLHLWNVTGTFDGGKTAAGADRILGGGGGDRIHGQGGDDTIRGEADDDSVEGGPGKDEIHGDGGTDAIAGGSGVDYATTTTSALRTWAGTPDSGDVLFGDDGTDKILGDNGNASSTTLWDVPTAGADPSTASAGDDVISGGADADRLLGQSGNDTITGGGGDDVIDGNSGADTADGDDGADRIAGGSQQGSLSTDSGAGIDDRNRTVSGQVRGDVISGGTGADAIVGDNGVPAVSGTTLHDVPSSGAEPAANRSGDDLIAGGPDPDRVFGQSGDDTITGGGSDDVVDGNSGADTINGDDGADTLVGGSQQGQTGAVSGAGIDDRNRTPRGEGSARGDSIHGDAGDDVVLGDNGRVTLVDGFRAVEEYDVWRRSATVDPAPNASGADLLWGDADRDRLFGQGKGDRMSGGSEDDLLSGDSGADTIAGDGGSDDITGGSGLAQLPDNLAEVQDTGDTITGGGAGGDGADGADVILGDNGLVKRPGGDDPNTGHAKRDVWLYDVYVQGQTAPAAVAGDDDVRGNAGRDLVYAQGGNDTVAGDGGDDWLEGNAGVDTIRGGDQDDDVLGGSSHDVTTLTGVNGKVGQPGKGAFPATPNKVLDAGDRLWGDDGNDAVVGDNGRVDRGVDGSGRWTYLDYKGTRTLLKRTVLGARVDEGTGAYGNDEGHGGAGHDEMYGQLGNDRFEGNDGADSVLGDLGEVVSSVRSGPSSVIEAVGFIKETINVPGTLKRTTTLYPVPSSATSGGLGGNDYLAGGLGDDVVHGGSGNDTMWGNRTFDAGLVARREPVAPTGLTGLDDDVLFGGHGDDQVWGGWQHDRMYGGHGNDRLDMVTELKGVVTGDRTVDFKGMDFMYGGWGQDGMQADWSKPSPDHSTDKMVDATGAYNGYFVCEGAYGGNSILRLLSPEMEAFWHKVAADDGLAAVTTTSSSNWWELGMVFNADRGKNANPVYDLNPAHFVCDTD